MKKEIKNIAASVRARLINIANESNRDYNALLRLYFSKNGFFIVFLFPATSPNLFLKAHCF